MGGKSTQQQQQSSSTQPWAPAQPALTGILGNLGGVNPNLTGGQSGAIAGLEGNAGYLNQFAPQVGQLTNDLFSGGTNRTGIAMDAYNSLNANLAPTINGDYLDPNKNPFFANTTNQIANDVTNQTAGLYAGAGRDPAGAGNFAQNVARGVAQGTAPIYASVYGQERGNQLNAANSAYGAGNATTGILSNLDQNALANRQTGLKTAAAGQGFANDQFNQILQAESLRTGIPIGILQQMAGIAAPIAGLGGQTNSNSSGSNTMSGAQQFATIAQGINQLWGGGGGGGMGGSGGGMGGGMMTGLAALFA